MIPSLADERGEVVRAAAWRLRTAAVEVPERLTSTGGDARAGVSESGRGLQTLLVAAR